MTRFTHVPRVGILAITALAGSVSLSAEAADRVLDLSSGCKVYRLQNKAWVQTDPASLEGARIPSAQILKDEKFTVFRMSSGIFGVSQKCMVGAAGQAPQQRQQQQRTATRRTTKQSESSSYTGNRGPWAVAVSLGMNLGGSGTVTSTIGGTASAPTESSFQSTIAFAGEASYRFEPWIRLAGEYGLSQLQESSSTGNEVSYMAIRPELTMSLGQNVEGYIGPTLGFFSLSQNAQSITSGATSLSITQQTASAFMIGLKLGADFALTDQFDLGGYFSYIKPGDLTVTGTQTAPTTATFSSSLAVKFMTIGARFVIHF